MGTWLRDLLRVDRTPRPLGSLDDAIARLAAYHPRVPREELALRAAQLTRVDAEGRLTHFMRRDELEAAWTWVEPIIEGWKSLGEKPRAYAAGSWGPAASSALMAREDSTWSEET